MTAMPKNLSIEYIPDESKWPEDVKALSKAAQDASRAAVESLLEKGIPVVYAEGRNIVKQYPDGRVEVIRENVIPEPLKAEDIIRFSKERTE